MPKHIGRQVAWLIQHFEALAQNRHFHRMHRHNRTSEYIYKNLSHGSSVPCHLSNYIYKRRTSTEEFVKSVFRAVEELAKEGRLCPAPSDDGFLAFLKDVRQGPIY